MATRTPGGANEICHIGFNQEQDCFAVGTQSGFRIYNTIPFRGQFVRGKQEISADISQSKLTYEISTTTINPHIMNLFVL